MNTVLVSIASLAVGLFVGSFLPAYMKRKGENLATHEDIDKLVDQVSAVTQTAKQIESKISDELWQRQQRWELKRGALVDLVKAIGALEDAAIAVHTVAKTANDSGTPETWVSYRTKVLERWSEASLKFDAAEVPAQLVCTPATRQVLSKATNLTRDGAKAAMQRDFALFEKLRPEFIKSNVQLLFAVRKELGIDEAQDSNTENKPVK